MAVIAYCPQCGYILQDIIEEDINDYECSRCRFCGFDKGLVDFSGKHKPMSFIKHMKFKHQLRTDDYFGYKPSLIEESHIYNIEISGINKNPLYNKDLAIKTAQLREEEREERLRAESDARHKQEMDKLWDQVHQSMASKPHCPTCGSTNVKKLDALDRAVSVGTLGVLSNKINKSFKCKDCGYTW